MRVLEASGRRATLHLERALPTDTLCTLQRPEAGAEHVACVTGEPCTDPGGGVVTMIELLEAGPAWGSIREARLTPRAHVRTTPGRLHVVLWGSPEPVAAHLGTHARRVAPRATWTSVLLDAAEYDKVDTAAARQAIQTFLAWSCGPFVARAALVLPVRATAAVQLLRLARSANLADRVFCGVTSEQASAHLER